MRRYIALLVMVVAGAASQSAGDVPANVPKDGLVAFWSCDGHARDSAGKNHGTIARG